MDMAISIVEGVIGTQNRLHFLDGHRVIFHILPFEVGGLVVAIYGNTTSVGDQSQSFDGISVVRIVADGIA